MDIMKTPTTNQPRVSRKEVVDALQYFHGIGMIDNLHGDAEHYCKILMEFAAMRCGITLE